MPVRDYINIIVRAFALAIVVFFLAIIGELFFVYAMKFFDSRISFTSFYALGMFAGFAGFIPFSPSPSRLSSAPIGLGVRLLLIVEVTALVIIAIFSSWKFMTYKNLAAPIDVIFAAYIYVIVLVVSLVVNFSRIRSEFSTKR